jgi:hypothetical protein
MRSLAFILVAIPLAHFSASAHGQTWNSGQFSSQGAPDFSGYSPSYGSPNFYHFGAFGNGIYGPGYNGLGIYSPGINRLSYGGSSPLGVDPSLYYHTYPNYSSPYLPPLAPNTGLPSLSDGVLLYPRIKPATFTWPSRGKIRIELPADAAADIDYALNSDKYTIKPGYNQTFDDDRKWTMTSTDGAFKKRYLLTAGNYRFYKFDTGWELREVIDKPAASIETPPAPLAH